MNHADIAGLLRRRFGLEAESIGSTAIERAVRDRLAACNLRDIGAYFHLLVGSDAELRELIELLVVPETWFFRDTEAFAELARFVMRSWLPAHPSGTLRLLSLPCSTGEEPYSMAMALLDAGIPAARFEIDAVDLSDRALARAREGVYGKNSFRSRDLEFRERHFKATSDGWRLGESARRQVRFQLGNLAGDDLLPGIEMYDAIFCRNLLIYFDPEAKERAITALARLLRTEGVLFVGPSEAALVTGHHFVSMKVPLAFAFRKTATAAHEPRKLRRRLTARVAVVPPPARHEPAHRHHAPAVHHAPAPAATPGPVLEEAVRLADAGRLDEATRICEEHIRAHGPSARAYFFLGLVRDAAGDPKQAEAHYRKALYLEPRDHDTLVQLALLLDKQGDKAGAKVLNERAARAGQKERK